MKTMCDERIAMRPIYRLSRVGWIRIIALPLYHIVSMASGIALPEAQIILKPLTRVLCS